MSKRRPLVAPGARRRGARDELSRATCAADTSKDPYGNLLKGTNSSKCAGMEDAISGAVDWRPVKRVDVYAGAMYSKISGGLASGYFADIVVFDPDKIDYLATRTVSDVPGGGSRLWRDAVGVRDVIVNGQIVVRDGAVTGALPGRVLRSTGV